MDHEFTMKALKHHVKEKWILLYVERWLKAPMINKDGLKIERAKGTPQGGVISPILANLFMHYAFDKWMERRYPRNPFARYADDVVIHCRTKGEAEELLDAVKNRLQDCLLEVHPDKTTIIYCKDEKRKDDDHEHISFDFLGYTFRPRRSRTKKGKIFLNFCPAVSRKAKSRIREVIKGWNLPSKTGLNLDDVAVMINPQVSGWINYYGKFFRSALYHLTGYIEYKLCLWARRKYKRFGGQREKAREWLRRIRKRQLSRLFVHWSFVD